MNIRPAEQADAANFTEHLERLINTSGSQGPIFSPRENGEYKASESDAKTISQRWAKAVGEVSWERCFLCLENEQIIGHVLLRAKQVRSSLHRVDLQMGLEPAARNRGLGKKLLVLAIEWAKKNSSVEWIDLGVFESNEVAVRLYEKHGFVVTGRLIDSFRVHGIPMVDLTMALKLR